MNELINFDDVNTKIITIRNQNVILDSAVAELYGVETMHINQAVKRNLDRFPEGYVFELTRNEKQEAINFFETLNTSSVKGVITNCDNLNYTHSVAYSEKIKTSPTLPKAFTEKGLYMLATILKSPQAIQTTIAIVETFTKIRELSRLITLKKENTELKGQLQTISLLVINEIPLTKKMIMEIIKSQNPYSTNTDL